MLAVQPITPRNLDDEALADETQQDPTDPRLRPLPAPAAAFGGDDPEGFHRRLLFRQPAGRRRGSRAPARRPLRMLPRASGSESPASTAATKSSSSTRRSSSSPPATSIPREKAARL